MFDNIGKKIKTLTMVVCWIGMISSFITGIIILASAHNAEAIGIPIMLGGPLLFWLGSFLMYGFGELVDSTMSIEEMMRTGAFGGGGGSEGFAAPVTGSSASAKPVHTSDFTILAGADFKYTVNDDGSVCIMKYVGKTSAIRIPENLFGKSVTSLGDFVFSGNRTVTGIIVPDSVTSIGNGVFGNCAALSRIILPEGLTAIVNSAFFGCRSLTDIHIPESVTFIDQFAFANCVSLKEIRIPDGVTSIGDNAFSGCPDLTLVVTPGSCGEQYCKDNGLKYRYAD